MKRASEKDLILLAESGELGDTDTRKLEAHVQRDGDLRAFRADTRKLTTVIGKALEDDVPAPEVVARIRAFAGEHRPLPLPWYRRHAATIYAAAAALAILAGGTALLLRSARTAPVEDLHAILAMVGGDEAARIHAAAEAAGPATDEAAHSEDQLRALARQLLHMEGMAVEEPAADDAAEPGVSGRRMDGTTGRVA